MDDCTPGGVDSDDSDDDSDIVHVPEDPASQSICHQHAAAACAVSAAPSKSEQQPCIVCGGDHKFDSCTVLSDAKFLREHCTRYCQHLRHDATARAQCLALRISSFCVVTRFKKSQ